MGVLMTCAWLVLAEPVSLETDWVSRQLDFVGWYVSAVSHYPKFLGSVIGSGSEQIERVCL
jgi:hypothetical protein